MVYTFWSNAVLCTPTWCLLASKQGHGRTDVQLSSRTQRVFSLRPNLPGFMENLFILLVNTQNTFGTTETEFFCLSIFPPFSLKLRIAWTDSPFPYTPSWWLPPGLHPPSNAGSHQGVEEERDNHPWYFLQTKLFLKCSFFGVFIIVVHKIMKGKTCLC